MKHSGVSFGGETPADTAEWPGGVVGGGSSQACGFWWSTCKSFLRWERSSVVKWLGAGAGRFGDGFKPSRDTRVAPAVA